MLVEKKLKWKILIWQGKLSDVLLHHKRNYVEMVNVKCEIWRDAFVFLQARDIEVFSKSMS